MGEKKAKAKKIICQDMRDYWNIYKMPVKASSLRVRAARHIGKIDETLIDLLHELNQEKVIKVLITEKMTRFCVPYEFWEGMTKEEQFQYVRKLDPSNESRFKQIEESGDGEIPSSNFFSSKESF